jgi:hypothetical protein
MRALTKAGECEERDSLAVAMILVRIAGIRNACAGERSYWLDWLALV